jgi:hypothetical protein
VVHEGVLYRETSSRLVSLVTWFSGELLGYPEPKVQASVSDFPASAGFSGL